MKPGLRWDHKSRATWRPVWRLRCYRSDFLSLQEERVKYIAFFSHNNVSVYVFEIGFVKAARDCSTG